MPIFFYTGTLPPGLAGGGGGEGVGGPPAPSPNSIAIFEADGDLLESSLEINGETIISPTDSLTLPEEIILGDVSLQRKAADQLRVVSQVWTARIYSEAGGSAKAAIEEGALSFAADRGISWTNGSGAGGAGATGVSRGAEGVVSLDTGAPGNGLGLLRMGSGLCRGWTSSAAAPSLTEYPNDRDWGLHEDTVAGALYLAANLNGTIKSTQLL